MGCSSTRTYESYLPAFVNGKKRKLREETRRKYNQNHENFDTILLETQIRESFFSDSEGTEFARFFEQFYGKYKIKFDKFNMTYQEVQEVILERLVESQLKDCLHFRDWNVTEILLNLIEDQPDLNEEKVDKAKKFLYSTSRYFANKQKGCMLAFSESFEQLEKWGLTHYLTNLKFNANFQMEVLTLYLSPFMFRQEENIYDLCEVIECNPNITTLSALMCNFSADAVDEKILKNYIPEQKHTSQLSYLFQAVKNHPGINVFSFANVFYYMYSLPKETVDSLLSLIRSDKLIACNLIKINLPLETLREIIKIVTTLKNLKFLILDCKSLTDEVLQELKTLIIQNKKLNGCFICIGELDVNKEQLEIDVKSANPSIKYFECVKEFQFMN